MYLSNWVYRSWLWKKFVTIHFISSKKIVLSRTNLIGMLRNNSNYDFHYVSDIDDCQPNPCKNNGVCVDGINSYTCDCTHGFIGDNCSISRLSIFQDNRNFKIFIESLWSKTSLTLDIDDCEEKSCDNGGTCIDGIASFQCKCPVGFTGLACEISVCQSMHNVRKSDCYKSGCLH